MSVTIRLTGDVGDRDPVWRYLLEKLGHVALFSWILAHLFPLSTLWTAVAVAVFYTIGGKILWLYGARQRAIADDSAKISMHLQAGWTLEACLAWVADRPRFLKDDGVTAVRLWPELGDVVFDLVLVLYVPLITLAPGPLLFGLVAAWGLAIGAMFNNRWSSPGDVG